MNLDKIDIASLQNGSGDWRNMQDIIRSTFTILINCIEKQQEDITLLTSNIAKLKKHNTQKVSIDDMKNYVDNTIVSHSSITSLENNSSHFANEISNILREIDKKSSIHYVDNALKKKLNKSDIDILLINNIPNPVTSSQHTSDIKLEKSLKVINTTMNEKIDTISNMCKDEISNMKKQCNAFDIIISEKVNHSELLHLLDMKVCMHVCVLFT